MCSLVGLLRYIVFTVLEKIIERVGSAVALFQLRLDCNHLAKSELLLAVQQALQRNVLHPDCARHL